MAFCFKRKESVSKAIRRLARERAENAIKCLQESAHAETVHCARKDIKKVRAVLRLVHTQIATKDFCRLNKLLREAASYLAPPRDAFVKAKTLKNLTHHFKGQLAPRASSHVRVQLRAAFDQEMKQFAKERTARRVARILRRVTNQLARLEVSGKGWKALGPGMKAAYREGRRAYRKVLEEPTPENLHEWRKRVKNLWYQVSLLRPVWPEQMDAMTSELETLGECLGDDHDLFTLRQTFEKKCPGDVVSRELGTLKGLIDERQRGLQREALALGARFHTEKPSVFCKRLAGYWKNWRRKKKLCLDSAEATS